MTNTHGSLTETATTEVEIPPKLSLPQMLKSITNALHSGNISSSLARKARNEIGISQAYFTRKQPSKKQRKIKRKMQQASRRANR